MESGLDIRNYCIQQLSKKNTELTERYKFENKVASESIAKRIAVINEILKFENPILPSDLRIEK